MLLTTRLIEYGQSLWYDNIQRRLLRNGELARLIQQGEIRGITSNPTIFHNAIAKTTDYDDALQPLAWAGWDEERVFWQLAIEDIQEACDLFLPLYESTQGEDGYVSLEVDPRLAHQTAPTLEQARTLWQRVARPNLMIKIPATLEGLPAIRQAIAEGINVNVTLIFSLERYRQVIEAYLSGLEDRLRAGLPLHPVASVASFFVSRLDTKIDARLEALLRAEHPQAERAAALRGQAAIANARLAYAIFEETFRGPRWEALAAAGARLQRPLWASTSTKNPNYPDTLYVDNLIGPHTVNTVPPQTLEAFRDHGRLGLTVRENLDQARRLFNELEELGISLDQVMKELEEEGVRAFAEAFEALLQTLRQRLSAQRIRLGPVQVQVEKRLPSLERDSLAPRLWQGDATLWTADAQGQEEVRRRLGWLDLPLSMRAQIAEYQAFAQEIRQEGFTHFALLGMGGSSLASEVLSLFPFSTQASLQGVIFDTTDPQEIQAKAASLPLSQTLFIVSSKSGGTAEVMALLEYFWAQTGSRGSQFVAITDPGTSLETLARSRGFRHIFLADPNVGGRYSALSAFGLVPAALLGIDLSRLLQEAEIMRRQCRPEVLPARNPGLMLGLVLAEAVSQGRDKLTLLADPAVASFSAWVEQLIAESSGKEGKGILPVSEIPGAPEEYSADRLFVYFRSDGKFNAQVEALERAGHPILIFDFASPYALGAEFYRWEFATAVACALLGVNAFDQPNVEEAKVRARQQIARHQRGEPLQSPITAQTEIAALREFISQAKPGDFIAINAFLPRLPQVERALEGLQQQLRAQTRCAVTLGFGPRFLHSTGQYHKGGPNRGLFIVLTATRADDLAIPSQGLTFGTLQYAQALGDIEALLSQGRRVFHFHAPSVEALLGMLSAQ
ncbi:MAG: bifunctional transaldolase/phosoglucose isomerase [Anaerolineales bacterium]